MIAGSAGAAGLPFYAIICLPVLFAARMSLLDTGDLALDLAVRADRGAVGGRDATGWSRSAVITDASLEQLAHYP